MHHTKLMTLDRESIGYEQHYNDCIDKLSNFIYFFDIHIHINFACSHYMLSDQYSIIKKEVIVSILNLFWSELFLSVYKI